MALSTMVNWLCNFIIAFITPPLFNSIGAGYYFLLVGFCVVSGIFVYFVYPETAHLSLEQLGTVFGDKVQEEEKPVPFTAMLQVPEAIGRDSESTLRPSIDTASSSKDKKESSAL